MNDDKEHEVMEMLRRHDISQGRAAELLGMTRWDVFDLMGKYKVPAIDMTPEELREELRKPFPARKQEPTHAEDLRMRSWPLGVKGSLTRREIYEHLYEHLDEEGEKTE